MLPYKLFLFIKWITGGVCEGLHGIIGESDVPSKGKEDALPKSLSKGAVQKKMI